MKHLKKVDPQVSDLVDKENQRQETTLMMIPSENIASRAVEEAVSSSFGNKYAEGYPHRRYYQGQGFVDKVEQLAALRAKNLFGVDCANVQPYSGSPANLAILLAVCKPGDTIMGLSLDSGGHLTHGSNVSFTGKFFKAVQYHVGKDGYLDYQQIRILAKKTKPKVIIAGTTAYPRIINWKKFSQIADEMGAYLLADISHISGLIVGGAYPSPASYVHVMMTTTHKSLRGPRGAMILVTKKGLKKDEKIMEKIDKAVFPGLQGGPHENTIAGIAVALKEAAEPRFKSYAKQVVTNAKTLAKELLSRGFTLVSGGTDSHLILIDLRNKGLLGNTVAEALEAIGIVLNRNAVPFDPNPPFYPSGIRLGTPGITSRGMKEKEMKQIASFMDVLVENLLETKKVLKLTSDDEKRKETRKKLIESLRSVPSLKKEVLLLCKKFPVKETY